MSSVSQECLLFRGRFPVRSTAGLGLAADLSIDVAVARLGRNVWVDDPPPKNTLARHAELFQDSSRSGILDVAKGPDSMYLRKIGRPRYDGSARLSGVAMAPISACQRIPDVYCVTTYPTGD